MDGEFECLRQDFHSISVNLNTTANDEHNPVIERFIRTLKDAVRSIYVMLPFKRIPTIMLTDLVYYSVFWKNAFPHADNIDNRLSPRTIVTGSPLIFPYTARWSSAHTSKLTRTTTTLCRRGLPVPLPSAPWEIPRAGGISCPLTLGEDSVGTSGPLFPCPQT